MGCCNSKPKTKEAPRVVQPVFSQPKPVELKEKIAEDKPVEVKQDPYVARIHAIREARKQPFRFNRCTVTDGEVSALFEDGLVFRIVKDDVWYIYNDSIEYEAHVEHFFAPGSQITPGETTSMEAAEEDGAVHTQLVVYPLETRRYVAGTLEDYRGNVTTKPLGEAYRNDHCSGPNDRAADALAAARASFDGDAAALLSRCVAAQTPFVDVDFPPTPRQLSRAGLDAHGLPLAAMKRPGEFGQADATLFPSVVVPHAVEPGLLGDCWFTTAVAILAATNDDDDDAHAQPHAVRALFAQTRPEEAALGAYRVLLNRHGWWHSVLVDDFLPTIADVPIFARGADPRELWVPLLQKAYAKGYGSYAAITGGDALHALQDLTGAPVHRFDEAWAAAAAAPDAARAFLHHLAGCVEAGCCVVLSTPSHSSEGGDVAGRLSAVGLQLAHTYRLGAVVMVTAEGREVALLKVCNPWGGKGAWTGAWSVGSSEWAANPAAAEACGCNADGVAYKDDGSFWIAFEDAVDYFNGGGVVFTPKNAVDYRVKGTFQGVEPSVVLKVTVSKPVEVLLVLSQQDKRGLPLDDPAARFAPLMLSVAKGDGGKYAVEQNSGSNPAFPSADYTFAVARDVALRYTFEPSKYPYLVIPRLHHKGVVDGFERSFVLGVLASGAVDDALSIEFTRLSASNRVFQNLRTFSVGELPAVEAEHQKYLAGELPVSGFSSLACGVPSVGLPEVTVVVTPTPSLSEASTTPKEVVEEDIDFKVREDEASSDHEKELHSTEVHRMG